MRNQPTSAEHKLWYALRLRQIHGYKFRRQQTIGPFIVDFYCSTLRLVIEVDGPSHVESPYDPSRDAWLRAQGLQILRFWNDDVLNNLPGVLQLIAAVADPTPNPLPQGEGT